MKSSEHLSARQKMMFGLFCWGVQSWNYAGAFKDQGFDQKYAEARNAMRVGQAAYGLGILFLILVLWLQRVV